MINTLILPQYLIITPSEKPRRDWGVRVVDSQIDAIGPNVDLLEQYPEDNILEAPNHVLAPGFVNAHVHLYGVLAHGIPLENAPSGF